MTYSIFRNFLIVLLIVLFGLPSSVSAVSISDKDVDFSLDNITRPALVKHRQRRGGEIVEWIDLGITWRITSGSLQKEIVYFSSRCSGEKDGENVEVGFGGTFKNITPRNRLFRSSVALNDAGLSFLRGLQGTDQTFTCNFRLAGYLPDPFSDATQTAIEDADDTNDFFRVTMKWQQFGSRQKLVIVEKTREEE